MGLIGPQGHKRNIWNLSRIFLTDIILKHLVARYWALSPCAKNIGRITLEDQRVGLVHFSVFFV